MSKFTSGSIEQEMYEALELAYSLLIMDGHKPDAIGPDTIAYVLAKADGK